MSFLHTGLTCVRPGCDSHHVTANQPILVLHDLLCLTCTHTAELINCLVSSLTEQKLGQLRCYDAKKYAQVSWVLCRTSVTAASCNQSHVILSSVTGLPSARDFQLKIERAPLEVVRFIHIQYVYYVGTVELCHRNFDKCGQWTPFASAAT